MAILQSSCNLPYYHSKAEAQIKKSRSTKRETASHLILKTFTRFSHALILASKAHHLP